MVARRAVRRGLVVVLAVCVLAGTSAVGAGGDGKPEEAPAVKVVNNFVSELLSAAPGARAREYAFRNPREGWVYFRTEGSVPAGGSAEVYVDGQEKGEAVITHDAYTPATLEAMRYLGEGEHRVWVGVRGQGASVSTLVVRAVPEIQYATFPFTSFVQEYGTYDYAFLKRVGMLDAVNVCTARTGIVDGAVNDTTHRPVRAEGYDQLKALGKRILERRLMYNPGAKDRGLPEKDGAAGVYEYWSKSPGIGERVFDGLIIDEFSGGIAQYFPTYIEAIRRILGEDRKRLFYLVTWGQSYYLHL